MINDESNVTRKLALLELAERLGSVSEACRIIGVSRDTFYRAKQAFKTAGPEGLKNITRRKPNFKNRVPAAVEEAVLSLSRQRPTYGQGRIARELHKRGIQVSPAGVRCIWQRHGVETAEKRLALRTPNAPPASRAIANHGVDQ